MILDSREHGLQELLRSAPIQQLPVGDCWIPATATATAATTSENPLPPNSLIIERKAAADLESSILDGRYREQRTRLLSAAQQWSCRPVYIIEGDLDRMGPQVRLSAQALMKHVTRLSLRYGIATFQTASLQDTANLLLLLESQITAEPTCFEAQTTLTYTGTVSHSKAANRDDPRAFAIHTLTGCRGVSVAVAEQVLKGCGGTLEGVMSASASTIAALPENTSGKRTIGPARAARLHSLLHGSSQAQTN